MKNNQKHFQNLSEFLFDKIAENILNGNYKVGQKIVENTIMEEFDVSKSPVREALQLLIKVGLIEYKPRRGCYVKTISVKDVVNHYLVRNSVEGLAARLTYQEMPVEAIKELNSYYDMMKEAADKNDLRAYLDSHDLFHEFFAENSKNEILIDFCRSLRIQNIRYRLQFLNINIQYDLHTHDDLLMHLESKDITPQDFQVLMEEHIQHGLESFQKSFNATNKQ